MKPFMQRTFSLRSFTVTVLGVGTFLGGLIVGWPLPNLLAFLTVAVLLGSAMIMDSW